MLSDVTRNFLSDLNRRPTRNASRAQGPAMAAPLPSPGIDPHCPLPGYEQIRGHRRHWRIDRPVNEIWPDCETQLARRKSPAIVRADLNGTDLNGAHLDRADLYRADLDPDGIETRVNTHDMALTQFRDGFPRNCVFLDLETCGFSGSMIFLIGLVRCDAGRLILTQLLARDYSEEESILHALWELLNRETILLTFNGKSFDWPQIHDRSIRFHIRPFSSAAPDQKRPGEPARDADRNQPAPPNLPHIDLLHHSRRRWKHQLPNCKLQTLEYHICGRRRTGDIPGREIPDAYHHYVRTAETVELRSILHHNALDLVTLLQLSLTFLGDPT